MDLLDQYALAWLQGNPQPENALDSDHAASAFNFARRALKARDEAFAAARAQETPDA